MNKTKKEKFATAILEADSWKRIENYAVKQSMYTQAVIIKAFVSELYLKGILLIYDKTWGKNTHKLKTLYDLLPKEIKIIIKKNTEKELIKNDINNKNNKSFFPIVIHDPITNNLLLEIKSFGVALEIISNNFVNLRYNFDKVNCDKNVNIILYSFIDTFEKILKKTAYDIHNKLSKKE